MSPIKRVLLLVCFLSLLPSLTVLAAPERQAPTDSPAADWARVKAAGRLVVGTSADYPPFEFYSSNYELDGFDVALMQELGKRLGVQVVFNDFAFDGLLNAVRLRQVDVAIGAISVTPDRRQIVDFTNIYYMGEDAVLARTVFNRTVRTASDLAGQRVGVQLGSTYQAWVQENLVSPGLIPQTNLTTFSDLSSMVSALRRGRVDVILIGQLPAEQLARRFTDLKVVGDSFNRQQYAIAARSGSSLIVELNAALLKTQRDGTFAQLVDRYLGNQPVTLPNTTPTSPLPAVTPTPTGPPPCIHGMAYVADLNYDDRNMKAAPVMTPGQQFTKRWRVRNSGTCAWEPTFQLKFVSGNRAGADMGGVAVTVGKQVAPGQTVDLAAPLRAPITPGVYQGFWKMQDSLGRGFGEVIWVGIQVPDPTPPTPTPEPPLNPNLRADSSFVTPGQCTSIRWDVDNVKAVYFVTNGQAEGVGGHDTRNVCPTATTSYLLRVLDRANRTTDFAITITVETGLSNSAVITFWADPTNVARGQCTTLHWDVRNVRAVYLGGQGVVGQGSQQMCPNNTTTYTLRVILQNGAEETRLVTVTVDAQTPGPIIQSFTVNSTRIPLGGCVTLRWATANATSVNLSRSLVLLLNNWNPNATVDDCPPQTGVYEYRLDAFGNGQSSQRLIVEVTP